ncbi:hypothetical protein ACRAQ7_14015 [Erythrobacter sp. W53]
MTLRKVALAMTLVILLVLTMAWFDGGEEPLHQIEQTITVPERNE